MRILITGGTGMVGTALAKSLLAEGHNVWILTRNPRAALIPEGARAVGWDGRTSVGWGEMVNQMDAVVNLVGERLSRWPWTKRQKNRFWDSRVDCGHALVEAIHAAATPPQVLIQASGVNYYGPRDLDPVSEAQAPGKDFLADLCKAWEASTEPVERMGVRRIIIRSAIVLCPWKAAGIGVRLSLSDCGSSPGQPVDRLIVLWLLFLVCSLNFF